VLDTLGPPGRRTVERAVIADPFPAGPARQAVTEVSPLEVVMVGRVARWKGQDVFLRAFAEAFEDGEAHATLIGASLFGGDDDRFAREVDELIRTLGLESRVAVVG
jgi:glycosyltransferase involved in cell wall biosynthesis